MNLSDNIDDYCFMDFETRAKPGVRGTDSSVVTSGTYRYAQCSYPVLLTWAIGHQPVQLAELRDFTKRMRWSVMSVDLWRFYTRVLAGEAWFAAWNMGFDRAVWNAAFPEAPLQPEHTLDIMCQATASNLPPSLEGASKFIGRGGKQADGKALIMMFSQDNEHTPQSEPEKWKRYKSYATQDTDELRAVFEATRKLPAREWEEYWANERVNERGQMVDVEFVRRAEAIATLDKARTNRLLTGLTGGVVTTVTQHQRIANFIYDRLTSPEARALMTKEWADEDDETEEDDELKASSIGIDRRRVEALLAFFEAREEKLDGLTDEEWLLVDILGLRQFGGSASPLKFAKIMQQHDRGRLRGQYVFNGAAQTGRYSSKGVQVHNLTRSTLGGSEEEAIEMINGLEI